MTLLAPLYLLALIPFAAFAAWLLVGRRRRQWVPFLPLWDAPEELRRPKKGFEPPPRYVVFALGALLLALLALTRPLLTPPGRPADRGRVTLIVDRGASMSALSAGQSRFARSAQSIAPTLLEQLGPGPVDLIDPTDSTTTQTDREHWPQIVATWKRTAIDTSATLRPIVRQLIDQGHPTILLSDIDLGLTNDQLVQIEPSQPVNNTAIISLAERPSQIMVTLRSTLASSRTLTVRSAQSTASSRVDLQPNTDQRVFLNLTANADTIEATLDGQDDFDADDRAYLVRRGAWPIIEPRAALPDELRRMLDVYARHRRPNDGSLRLAVGRPADLKSDEPAILLPEITDPESPRGDVRLLATDHPILTGVDWSPLAHAAATAPRGPGDGWTTLAALADRPILAVRDGEVRQVWLSFESKPFARSPAFVVLWTNVLDWAGSGAAAAFSATTLSTPLSNRLSAQPPDADPTRWPGLFQSPTGKLAANAPPVQFHHDPRTPALSRLKLPPGTGVDLTAWLALTALASLALAAATWEKRRVPRRGTGPEQGSRLTPIPRAFTVEVAYEKVRASGTRVAAPGPPGDS